jgi:hypothetical protein
MIIEQRPTVKVPENKDKEYDHFIKCNCVKCKISYKFQQVLLMTFWIEDL